MCSFKLLRWIISFICDKNTIVYFYFIGKVLSSRNYVYKCYVLFIWVSGISWKNTCCLVLEKVWIPPFQNQYVSTFQILKGLPQYFFLCEFFLKPFNIRFLQCFQFFKPIFWFCDKSSPHHFHAFSLNLSFSWRRGIPIF